MNFIEVPVICELAENVNLGIKSESDVVMVCLVVKHIIMIYPQPDRTTTIGMVDGSHVITSLPYTNLMEEIERS